MNLKRLRDDLYTNPQTGQLLYKQIGKTGNLGSQRGLTFTQNTLFKKHSGIYALMKMKDSNVLTQDEVQEFLKRKLSGPQSLRGFDELCMDLNDSLSSFFRTIVVPDLKKSGIPNESVIDVELRLVESSSDLTRLLCSEFESFTVGGHTFQFNSPEFTFQKNLEGAWFDEEAFVDAMRNRPDFDEEKARAKAKEYSNRLKVGLAKGKGLSKIFGKLESYARDQVRDLTRFVRTPRLDGIVTLLVDDFLTTGSTLKAMEQNIRQYVDPSELVFVYKVALFSK